MSLWSRRIQELMRLKKISVRKERSAWKKHGFPKERADFLLFVLVVALSLQALQEEWMNWLAVK